MNDDDLICVGCYKRPHELEEYVEMAKEMETTPELIVRQEEGTLNIHNGHFLCTECYIRAGMPSSAPGSPGGWTAP